LRNLITTTFVQAVTSKTLVTTQSEHSRVAVSDLAARQSHAWNQLVQCCHWHSHYRCAAGRASTSEQISWSTADLSDSILPGPAWTSTIQLNATTRYRMSSDACWRSGRGFRGYPPQQSARIFCYRWWCCICATIAHLVVLGLASRFGL